MTEQQTPKGVVALVQSNVETRKTRILLAATELFVACEAPDKVERHVFAELFRQYIGDTPLDERRRIASLIARSEHVPHDTVLTLMRDEDISVAHRIVAYSPVITNCDLISAIGRGPEALRRAVTLRVGLAEEVVAALKLHSEPETLASLLAPGRQETPLDPAHTPMAPANETTAKAALETAPSDATRLGETPTDTPPRSPRSAPRDQVRTEPDDAPAIRGSIDEMADAPASQADPDERGSVAKSDAQSVSKSPADLVDALTEALADPTVVTAIQAPAGDLRFLAANSAERTAAIAAAQGRVMAEMAAGGSRVRIAPDTDMLRCLEQSAMARDKESFLGVLAPMLDVDIATAERITLDAGGEPLIVALSALGMATSRTVSVMIQMSPAVYDIVRLRELSTLRSNLDRRAATRIANDWRRTLSETQAEHQPVLDAAERPHREAGTAKPASKIGKSDILILRDVVS